MKHLQSLVQGQRSQGFLLKGIYGVKDDTRMRCVHFEDIKMLKAFWQGYTQETEAANILVGIGTGEIKHAPVNVVD